MRRQVWFGDIETSCQFESDRDDDRRFKRHLERTSVREGLRVVPLMEYRGVELDVLDESSLMTTGTLKSIDGCIAATCKKPRVEGFDRCVFESGGNTGSRVDPIRCSEIGFRDFLSWCRAENVNASSTVHIFERSKMPHLIAVDDPGEVKPTAARIATLEALRRIPDRSWRSQSSSLIGCFVLEHFLANGAHDHMVQSDQCGVCPHRYLQSSGCIRRRTSAATVCRHSAGSKLPDVPRLER